jgi:hypothetical protein
MILLVMIILHSATGTAIDLNTAMITNLRNPEPGDSTPLFTKGVKCQINLADGKFVTVTETCNEVRRIMEDRKHKK